MGIKDRTTFHIPIVVPHWKAFIAQLLLCYTLAIFDLQFCQFVSSTVDWSSQPKPTTTMQNSSQHPCKHRSKQKTKSSKQQAFSHSHSNFLFCENWKKWLLLQSQIFPSWWRHYMEFHLILPSMEWLITGKRKTKNEVDGQHQAWHEQVWFGGRIRPRQEKNGTEPWPGIIAAISWTREKKKQWFIAMLTLSTLQCSCTLVKHIASLTEVIGCQHVMLVSPYIIPSWLSYTYLPSYTWFIYSVKLYINSNLFEQYGTTNFFAWCCALYQHIGCNRLIN